MEIASVSLVILPVKTSCSKAYAIKELAPPFPNDVMELSNTLPHVEFCLAPEDANICESMQMEKEEGRRGTNADGESWTQDLLETKSFDATVYINCPKTLNH